MRDSIAVSGSNITKPNGINDASVIVTSMLIMYSLEIQLLFMKILLYITYIQIKHVILCYRY